MANHIVEVLKIKHYPEEDYWRTTKSLNDSVNGGKGFTDKEHFDIIRKERKLLEQLEQEAYDEYNRQ